MTKLTVKQEKFCQTYIETGNASEAYRKAYSASKMKEKQVWEEASKLLKTPKVSQRVISLREAMQKRHEITVDRIARELALIGFSNMLDYVTPQEDGTAYVDLSALTRDQAAAISEVTVESYTEGHGEGAVPVKRVKFKLSDKRSALVDLGKHMGMFVQKHEITGKDGGPIETKDVSDTEAARRVAYMLGQAITRKKNAPVA